MVTLASEDAMLRAALSPATMRNEPRLPPLKENRDPQVLSRSRVRRHGRAEGESGAPDSMFKYNLTVVNPFHPHRT